eukprot:maker-scaffold645_size120276-snap-gene-0.30 protein:Tk11119 transcript:maker-scaffold645_size120276-snap-gene-0.30-mRNA-1 annotation:"death-inducer obliterator 1"
MADAGEEAAEKSVTIMIDENQKMIYDQTVLQSIIESNQASTQVTFVRLGQAEEAGEAGEAGQAGQGAQGSPPGEEFVPSDVVTLDLTQHSGAGGHRDSPALRDLLAHATLVEPADLHASNSILLDQEQISQLESVLQSSEAKDMLGPAMLGAGPLDHILDGEDDLADLESDLEPTELHPDHLSASNSGQAGEDTASSSAGSPVKGPPKRRSQRQMDKEMKEEAERIRSENQVLFQREKQDLSQPIVPEVVQPPPSPPVTPATSVAAGRPKRQRKVPAHLQGDFVTIDVIKASPKAKKDIPIVEPEPPAQMATTDEPVPEEPEPTVVETVETVEEDEDEKREAVKQKTSSTPKDDNIEDKKHPIKRPDSGKVSAASLRSGHDFERKPKGKTCFECPQAPLEKSLYCSDSCIGKHVERAKKAFASSQAAGEGSGSNLIIVMNPSSNQMFSGPSAPTEKTLSDWMVKHPDFHVVIPKSMTTSKFYGAAKKQANQKPNRGPKIVPAHDKGLKNSIEVDQKLAEYKSIALSNLNAARENLQASLKEAGRRITDHGSTPSKYSSDHKRKSLDAQPTPLKKREPQPKKVYNPPIHKGEVITPPRQVLDPKPLRENAVKGLLDALKGRIEKSEDLKFDEKELKHLVSKVEHELYLLYNKDVGSKYKNQYRRLVFNMKDLKNNGLFRKVLNGRISPKKLVDMSPDEMASKELQQWREAELKHDIEKIKSHQLEMLAMGNKLVVKSHKGEEIIETEKSVNVNDVKIDGERVLDVVLPDSTKEKKEKPNRDRGHSNSSKEKDRHRTHHSSSSKSRSNHRSSSRKEGSSGSHEGQVKSPSSRQNSNLTSSHTSAKSDKDHKHHSHHKNSSQSRERSRHRSSGVSSSSRIGTAPEASTKEKTKQDEIEKAVKQSMGMMRKAKQLEEAQRQKEFSEKVAKAEKAILEFNQTMASKPVVAEPAPSQEVKDRLAELASPPEEVSSTVQIKTPESSSQEVDEVLTPVAWEGIVNMPDVANFNIKAFGLSGPSDFLQEDLPKDVLKVVGRIPPETVWKYIIDLAGVATKEIMLIRLEAASESDRKGYDGFFSYLTKKGRLGVIGNCSKMVKDCYVVPAQTEADLPDCLCPLDSPGLKEVGGNVLMALIVRTVRHHNHRAGRKVTALKVDSPIETSPADKDAMGGTEGRSQPAKKKRKVEVRLTSEPEDKSEPSDEYDPALAGNSDPDTFPGLSPESENEDYDPERAFLEDASAIESEVPTKKSRLAEDELTFSPSESPPTAPQPITQGESGGFAEKLKKLAAQIAKEKAEIAAITGHGHSGPTLIEADKRKPLIQSSGPAFAPDPTTKAAPGFQGLPSTISSILFGGNASSETIVSRDPRRKELSTTLSKMSDADLLAKAQEMEGKPESLMMGQLGWAMGVTTFRLIRVRLTRVHLKYNKAHGCKDLSHPNSLPTGYPEMTTTGMAPPGQLEARTTLEGKRTGGSEAGVRMSGVVVGTGTIDTPVMAEGEGEEIGSGIEIVVDENTQAIAVLIVTLARNDLPIVPRDDQEKI